MYYKKQSRKTNTPQREPLVDVPINDVWESYQEPKSYSEFGVSDAAYAFFSNNDQYCKAQQNNQYWNSKKDKLRKYLLVSFFLWIPTFIAAMSIETIIWLVISVALFLTWLILTILSSIYERKIVNTYDNYRWGYEKYMNYSEQYNKKKIQYLNHNVELEGFKNQERTLLNTIAEQLKRVQGRTYRTEEDWKQMTDRDFEIEIGKVYSRLGYDTKVTKQSGDGGVDVIAKKDNEIVYIQCKHYGKNTHLGAPELQGFWGCCSGNGIKKGIMVCTSSLTKEAQSFASKLKGKLEIVGMRELLELDKSFYHAHPNNALRSFNDSFKTFIFNNHFIDCYHLWLLSEVFYNEEDVKARITSLNKWKDYSYVTKDIIVNLTNKIRVYVVLLVPNFLLKEVQEIRLADYNRSVVIY